MVAIPCHSNDASAGRTMVRGHDCNSRLCGKKPKRPRSLSAAPNPSHLCQRRTGDDLALHAMGASLGGADQMRMHSQQLGATLRATRARAHWKSTACGVASEFRARAAAIQSHSASAAPMPPANGCACTALHSRRCRQPLVARGKDRSLPSSSRGAHHQCADCNTSRNLTRNGSRPGTPGPPCGSRTLDRTRRGHGGPCRAALCE